LIVLPAFYVILLSPGISKLLSHLYVAEFFREASAHYANSIYRSIVESMGKNEAGVILTI
jgi:hypothetical protein